MTDLETRMTAAPEVEREFQTVTRDLASARAKYEELLKRQMDAEVSEAAIAGGTADKFQRQVRRRRCRTSRRSRSASRSSRSRLVLALIAALTAIVFAQILDPTVRGVRDIRDILDVTPLTAVPVIERPGPQSRRLADRHRAAAFSTRNSLTRRPFMSIIEEAVRKNAERHRQSPAPIRCDRQTRLRRVPAAPVDTAHAQRFQPITLDKAALHDNLVLPQLQDAGALRAYKILRTRVLRRLEANQWHSFARHRRDGRRGQDAHRRSTWRSRWRRT